MNELSVRLEKTIHAHIERVFDAWLDPEILSGFMLPMPGMPEPEIDIDAEVGGRFTILMHVGEDIVPHSGTYLAIERPGRLVFSWESPYSADDSRVTLTFTSLGEQQTRVNLLHERFPNEDSRSDHEGGWKHILDKLDEIAYRGPVYTK